jgi:hypothetical protein
VAIDPSSGGAHRQAILGEFVIPELRALPGFVRAVWLNDRAGTGTCMVVFESEDAAKAGLAVLTRPGGPPVVSSGLHEVEAQA